MSVESLPKTIVLNREGTVVTIINQTKLPQNLEFVEVQTWQQMVKCIKNLEVRGAPAIGIAGAYALVLALRNQMNSQKEHSLADCLSYLEEVSNQVVKARPTAVNLEWALNRVVNTARKFVQNEADATVDALINAVQAESESIRDADESACRRIGAYGAELLSQKTCVLTHCNAGSLATSFYGTALGVIYSAHEQGKINHVYVDETRPVGQGARLSVWELSRSGIPVTLQCDNMAASLMAQGKIDVVIVGADRICANGDTANKIGTYGLAVLAKYHGIPLYVAAPFSTIDKEKREGSQIPIEFRGSEEISENIPVGVEAYNPAFDVTPAELISAIITEEGVFYPPYCF